jgi:hypothetical protein
MMSVGPPATKGTIARMGLVGYSCECARPEINALAVKAASAPKLEMDVIKLPVNGLINIKKKNC